MGQVEMAAMVQFIRLEVIFDQYWFFCKKFFCK